MQADNELTANRFHQGTNYFAYEYMGVHKTDGMYSFRVWAPHADTVLLTGDFNGWKEDLPLSRADEYGIWEICLSEKEVRVGDKYKYRIYGGGQVHYKADPFAFQTECPPDTASVIPDNVEYAWRDQSWISFRRSETRRAYARPVNIYELHLGSWKRGEDGGFLNYTDIATELAPYVKQMGYTHIQIMPITEYPFDGSWGYQPCSYFAPTARYGSPTQFKELVDIMHEAGIGVILDWSPMCFPKDRHGLFEFDGKPLYEYLSDANINDGKRYFDISKGEVRSFLFSSAFYWIREFHVDALKVSYSLKGKKYSVSAMYAEDAKFLKMLNLCIKREFPDVFTISDGAAKWSDATSNSGLGFDLVLNSEWTGRTFEYAALDPIYRKYHHQQMTSPYSSKTGEKCVLPITHNDVVVGKKSFLDKMSGDYWQKFANARAILGYMMTQPGKKLFFMGGELGHFREWDHDGEMEWFLLEYEAHAKFQRYVSELNYIYLSSRELWENDTESGFYFIDKDNADQSVISYRRFANDGSEIQVVINFTPVVYEDYMLGVPQDGIYEEILNSDDERFGGGGVINSAPMRSQREPYHGLGYSLKLRIPPLGIVVLRKK